MWWLLLNLIPSFNIALAISAMPSYYVSYRPISEFIVLGAIPGTSIDLDFIDALLVWLVILSAYLLYRTFQPKQKQKLSY